MLRIPTAVPDVKTNHAYPLDPFQKQAIYAIQQDENVLVTAKTGSGKTLVGEYQIEHSLAKSGPRRRVFYTTPIKSLTNQKFNDLKELYGDGGVGIMTGDIKFCPHADVVVMTTEILRNLLFKRGTATEGVGTTALLSLNNVDAVVFDEVHYINDPERGKVWEECIMLLPPEINLVMLSATIDSPELFASWVGELKQRPVHLISTQYRVVPLRHCIFDGNFSEQVVMDQYNLFHREVYANFIRRKQHDEDEQRRHADAVRARGGEDAPVERTVRTQSFVHRMNDCINTLSEKALLPGLFFVFSRRQCEQYADKVEHSLLSSKESAEVQSIVRFHLHRYKDMETVAQYHTLMKLLVKGVAFHHSGVLPLLKEIVEVLFGKGLIKVLFATETFAVGINMPTKTVVFTSYRKVNDEGVLRMLRPHEYIQMAGRAGRRGKDAEGLVLYLPAHRPEHWPEVQAMMTGKSMGIESRMDFHYDFIIKCMQAGMPWEELMKKSYWYAMRMAEIDVIQAETDGLQSRYPPMCLDSDQFHIRESLETGLRSAPANARKELQRQLSVWKNKHVGPRWETGWGYYKTWTFAQGKIAYNNASIEALRKVELPFAANLIRMGYVHDSVLTDAGILASEINEGHPLLMSSAFAAGLFRGLSAPEVVALVACFIGPDPHDYTPEVPPEVAAQYGRILSIRAELMRTEAPCSNSTYWDISPFWMKPLLSWATGGALSTICADYELYEGNVVKAILKAAGILTELHALAVYTQNLEMLEVLREFTIVRDVVVPNSLYLTI